jgi:signal peptidase II
VDGADVGAKLPLAASFVLILDRLTKVLVAGRLAEGQSVRVGSWLRIRHVANLDVRQRPMSNSMAMLLLWACALGIIIFITKHGTFFQSTAAQIGLGAALGGATSNLYDRLRRGAVIDFLDVGWWPVFNLADVAITLGATIALCFIR